MKTKSILVVEDCPIQQEILTTLLHGASLHCATTEKEALEMAQKKKFDLVILDIILSEGNGFNVCRELRSRPSFVNTPILMVTSQINDSDKERAIQMGADDYMTKPYHVNEFTSKVKNFLNVA